MKQELTPELTEEALKRIREVAEKDHCLDVDYPCDRCPLKHFNNDNVSCSENAKRLLVLLGYKEE
jgi:hypothetical protein